jgi:hypothetical protein
MLGEHQVQGGLDGKILQENARFGIALHVFIQHEIEAGGAGEGLKNHVQRSIAKIQRGNSTVFRAQCRFRRPVLHGLGCLWVLRRLRGELVQQLFRFQVAWVQADDMSQLCPRLLEITMVDQIFGHPDLFLGHLRGPRRLNAFLCSRIVSVQIQDVVIQLASLCEP